MCMYHTRTQILLLHLVLQVGLCVVFCTVGCGEVYCGDLRVEV